MEFAIQTASDPISDIYEVRIRAMHGDGDNYETVKVKYFHKDEEEHLMVDLVETLNRMKEFNAWPHNYSVVEGFNRWFNYTELSDEEWEALGSNHHDLAEDLIWPSNQYGDPATMHSFKIIFYDWAGRECLVEIVY